MTLSHPAAVLPLRRLGLPFTAVVIGSMVPDVPLFARWDGGYRLSHGLLGVATVDLALTMVLVWLWFGVARDALLDLAPDPIRSRLAPHMSLTIRQWLLVVPAAWIGAFTHAFWDAFTHPGRGGVSRIAWLQEQHGPLIGYRWAQYVSGVIGLAVVCVAAARFLRSQPVVTHPTPRPELADRLLLAAATVIVVTAVVTAVVELGDGLHAVLFNSVVNAVIATAACTAARSGAWYRQARSWRATRQR